MRVRPFEGGPFALVRNFERGLPNNVKVTLIAIFAACDKGPIPVLVNRKEVRDVGQYNSLGTVHEGAECVSARDHFGGISDAVIQQRRQV